MEQDLILHKEIKPCGKSLLESRKMKYQKLNNSFHFFLDDKTHFFITFYFDKEPSPEDIEKNKKNKIILNPPNNILKKILKCADSENIEGFLILNISNEVLLMHLLDAILIILKDLKIDLLYEFEAFNFKIFEDEENRKFVLDTDLPSDKEVLIVKAGDSDIFLLESIGEIEKEFLIEIVEACFE